MSMFGAFQRRADYNGGIQLEALFVDLPPVDLIDQQISGYGRSKYELRSPGGIFKVGLSDENTCL